MDSPLTLRRNLRLLWFAQFISKIGDQLFAVAGGFIVMLLASPLDGEAPTELGIFEMVHALPALLIGPFLGVIVDRSRRKQVMIFTDLARAALLMTIPILAWNDLLSWWGVCAVGFGVFSFTSAFGPARDALVPILAKGQDLTKVNVLFQSSLPVAVLLGSALFVVIKLDEASPLDTLIFLILIDAGSFILSAVLLWALKVKEERIQKLADRPSVLSDTRESVIFAIKNERLRALLVTTAISNFFIMGPAIIGTFLLAKLSLGYSASEAPRVYGLFEGSMLVGMLLGMLWVMRWGRNIPRGKLLIAGLLLDGLSYLPFVFFRGWADLWVYLVTILLHGFFIPWIWIVRTSMIQDYYPNLRHGRIFALIGLTVTGFHALSAGATGLLGEYVDAHWLFFWGGVGGTISGLIGLSSKSLRRTD